MLTSPAGKREYLTSGQIAVLRVLAENVGRPVSREDLFAYVRGRSPRLFDRSIDIQISRLRRVLQDPARDSKIIHSVRGFGYLLSEH